MSDLDGLINMIPIDDIAKKLGVDPSIAKMAVAAAVPAIVGGLSANANSGGAESLEKALSNHETIPTSVDDIDEADGAKIVNHVFGANKTEVVDEVAKKAGGVDLGPIIAKVLPIIAPIVLAFLASQLTKKSEPAAAAPAAAPASSGGDIGSLLGGLLSSPDAQNMVGGLLGGLLGGKK